MNDEAFGAALMAELPKLQKRALKLLPAWGDADNLALDTVANAWSAYHRGLYREESKLYRFLSRTLSRLYADHLRSRHSTPWNSLDRLVGEHELHPFGDLIPGDEDVESTVVTRDELQAALAALTKGQRVVMVQLLSGRKQSELAQLLHVSEKTVASTVHRGRERARKAAGMPPLRVGVGHAGRLMA